MGNELMHLNTIKKYTDHINPYLAKLMNFAGFGVEVKGEGCYLYDHEGNKFLDCLGSYGVFILGHRHPKVVEAVKAQLDQLPISGKVFFNSVQADLAEKLAQISPERLQYTFFSNSGAESVEAALKFAKGTTKRTKFVSTHGGYHGKTIGNLSTTGREKYRKPFGKLMPEVEFIEYGNIEQAQQAIDEHTAAIIVETIQGEGGIHVPPKGYLKAIREACDKAGALLILDEVQTGIGRTGKMFGCEHEGVEPDIMTLAKALSGGVIPIGATLFTKEIVDAIYSENPLLHTSTFGGNPIACAAGLATIKVIEEEGLIEIGARRGKLLKQGLQKVQEKYPDMIAEVRGEGLMLGVEFAVDDAAELTIGQMTKRGVIAAYTLNNPRVIRFEPPLIITEEEIERAVNAFDESVAETKELICDLLVT